MFYRLPVLFSTSFYIWILLIQILSNYFGFGFTQSNIPFFYYVSKMMMDNITSFFYILLLSSLFFYQSKIYFYTAINKQKIIIFSIIYSIVYQLIKYFSMKAALFLIYPAVMKIAYAPNYSFNIEVSANIFVLMVSNVWLFILSGIILYLMTKYAKAYCQIPLINDATKSNPDRGISDNNFLSSHANVAEYKKLYAIIFSSLFCCIINAILWNTYFRIFDSMYEFRLIIDKYYLGIFSYSLFSIIVNYYFLYYISQKLINRTYSWLPISSLLMSCTITFLIFSIVAIIISCFMLPFLFESIILFILWFAISYALLYVVTRFSLRRYFA